MRVFVLHNVDFGAAEPAPAPAHAAGDAARGEIVDVAARVAAELRALGHEAERVAVETIADLEATLARARPDLVVNLVESLSANAAFEPFVARTLERHGIAFTGSPASTLRACLDKYSCSVALRRAGVPVPEGLLASRPDEVPDRVTLPCIVKPNREDGSIGISNASVCASVDAARARVAEIAVTHRQPALVQTLVGCREVNVSLLGAGPLAVLPLSEIAFRHRAGAPRIVTYDSKWTEDSEDWTHTPVTDATLRPGTVRRIGHVARRVERALGLRDYGRLDLRLDDDENFWVIDVNPNCGLAPDAGFARSAHRSGLDYGALCGALLQLALHRAQPRTRARGP